MQYRVIHNGNDPKSHLEETPKVEFKISTEKACRGVYVREVPRFVGDGHGERPQVSLPFFSKFKLKESACCVIIDQNETKSRLHY